MTKISFDARITELLKDIETKNQVKTAFDLRDRNRDNKKTLNVLLKFFIGKSYCCHDTVVKFWSVFRFLLVLLIEVLDGNLESHQKKVLQLLLYQKIVLPQNLLIFIIPK